MILIVRCPKEVMIKVSGETTELYSLSLNTLSHLAKHATLI